MAKVTTAVRRKQQPAVSSKSKCVVNSTREGTAALAARAALQPAAKTR